MDNEKLLNSMYQNIQMVLETLPEILNASTDCDFKAAIESQLSAFQSKLSAVRQQLNQAQLPLTELNDLVKNYSEWMTKIKSIMDKSTTHLAEMCINGYTMGMIDAIQNKNKYCDADKDILQLVEQITRLHEESIDSLKKYL